MTLKEITYTAPGTEKKREVAFERKVNYYETDRMGIVHHSNYIRWFEEARMYYLELAGIPYEQMEADGFMIPVLSVSAAYKVPVKYGQTVQVDVWIEKNNGIRLRCGYRVIEKESGTLCVTGSSEHCYVNMKFKPISLKKTHPYFYERIKAFETEQT